MKVITIGSDKRLFEKGSAVFERNKGYASRMEELHIIVFTTGGAEKEIVSGNLYIHPTNSMSRWMYVFDAYSLGKKIIKQYGFVRGASVVSSQDPFESGLVAVFLNRKFRLSLQVQVHTDLFSPHFNTTFLDKIRSVIAPYVLPKANGIRVVSDEMRSKILKHFPRISCPVEVLPIFVDIRALENAPITKNLQLEFSRFNIVILMASRLTKEKQIETALYALKKVVEKNPYACLVIAGEGPEKNTLEALAKSLGLVSNVSFIGWQKDLATLFKTSHMFLSTSAYEGYGMTLLEAGAAGCAVITSNVGIAKEICVDKENAMVCPVGDVDCFADRILTLTRNAGERELLKQKLQASVLSRAITREEYTSRYVGLLEKLVPLSAFRPIPRT